MDNDDSSDTEVSEDLISMPLDNQYNFGYIGEFYLGSVDTSVDEDDTVNRGELQKIRILLDTGSPNSWVFSNEVCDDVMYSCFDPNLSRGGTYREPEEDEI